jgi:putative ABC transport system permease protein
MSVFMTLRIALKALARNKMRTALTMLGMIIGVAAVITMVALGTGAQSSIDAQIQTMGTNTIQVQSGNYTQGGVRQGQGNAATLTPEDATAIAEVPGVLYAAASQNTRGQMVAGNQNWNTQLEGTDVDYPLISSWQVEEGAFFTPQDVATAAKVLVIGSVVRDNLFGPGVDPVGQTVRVQKQPFTVVGVMTAKGQTSVGEDRDDRAFTPYTTVL